MTPILFQWYTALNKRLSNYNELFYKIDRDSGNEKKELQNECYHTILILTSNSIELAFPERKISDDSDTFSSVCTLEVNF